MSISILTLYSIILSIFPFLYITCFKNKVYGFLTIILGILSLHFFTGLFLQGFGIFRQETVISFHTIFVLGLLIYKRPSFLKLKKVFNKSLIVPVLLILVTVLFLYSTHFDYKGLYSILSISEYQEANGEKFLYPSYSDEWSGIALIKKSIEEKSYPSTHPFNSVISARNYEMATHTLLGEIFLFFDIDPLHSYIYADIFFNTLLVLLLFILLKLIGIHSIPSSITSFFLIYIPSAANMPGIWTLIPLTFGVLFLLTTMSFSIMKSPRITLFSMSIALVFYPPIAFFLIPFLIVFYKYYIGYTAKEIMYLMIYIFLIIIFVSSVILIFGTIGTDFDYSGTPFLIATLVLVFILCRVYSRSNYISKDRTILFYLFTPLFVVTSIANIFIFLDIGFINSFTFIKSNIEGLTISEDVSVALGLVPIFSIFDVIPEIIIVLSVLGATVLYFKNRKLLIPLIVPILIGLSLWALYAFTYFRTFISYGRIVFITSLFIIIMSSIGFQYIYDLLKKFIFNKKYLYGISFVIMILFIFIFYPSYTSREGWKKFVIKPSEYEHNILPGAPVNRYLTDEDLLIFSNLEEGSRFLSLPWKGLVIGTATNHIPISAKSGYFTHNISVPQEFLLADCREKASIMRKYSIDYAYFPKFECDEFIRSYESPEGFILYELSNNS